MDKNTDWEAIGKKWLAGEVIIEEFNGFHFNPKQIEYLNDKSPDLLICGGFRSGKTVAMIAKMWLLSMFFPGNKFIFRLLEGTL